MKEDSKSERSRKENTRQIQTDLKNQNIKEKKTKN